MTTAVELSAQDIRARLSCGKQSCACSKNGTLTHCVVHSDGTPSLSIQQGHTAPLVTCQTGCSRESVIAALKQRGLWPEREQSAEPRQRREPQKVHRYLDDTGLLVAEKGRFEYLDRETGEMKKYFNWRMPGGSHWGPLAEGCKVEDLPMLNLPDVINRLGETVWVVEGEKAAEACTLRGMLAVTFAGGASQKSFGDSLAYLVGREVVLWPDNDGDGFALMGRLSFFLPSARIVRPALGPKEDADDYFNAHGGSVEGLAAMAQVEIRRAVVTDLPTWSARFPRSERYAS